MENDINLALLDRQIEILRHWIDVQQKTNGSIAETSPNIRFDVWRNAIEELVVCQNALRQQHKQITIALQTAEKERQRYQDLFDLAPDSYVVTDTSGAVQQANDAAVVLLGRPQEWLVGKSLILFIEQEERRRFRSHISRLVTEQKRHEWTVQITPHNRLSLPALMIVMPVFDATGAVSKLLWLIRDIRGQRWAEEELRKASHELAERVTERTAQLVSANEALRTEILARQQAQIKVIESERLAVLGVTAEKIAHEIGNALNNLSTTVQLQRYRINSQPSLQDGTLEATVRDLQHQLQRLSEIVHGWRSLAQLSRLYLEPLDLSVLVGKALENYARRIIDQEVKVEQSLPEHLPHVRADREKMLRAVSNLCAYALNSMSTGGTLTIRLSQSQARESMIVEVGDTGPSLPTGIDFFDLFTTVLPPGVGLGLAIADQIINAHGGKMTYESTPDIGNIIRVILPVEK